MADNNKLELVVEVDVNKANASIKSVNAGLSSIEQAAGKAARGASAGIDGLTVSMVKGSAAGNLLADSIKKALDWAKEWTLGAAQHAAHTDKMSLSMAALAKAHGVSAEASNRAVEAVKKVGFGTQDAIHAVDRLMVADMNLSKAEGLAKVAKDAAAIENITPGEALEKLLMAIESGASRGLRTMGIFVDLNKEVDRQEKLTGRTLDENEVRQFRYNAVMREAAKIQGAAAAATGSAEAQCAALAREVNELKEAVGEQFQGYLRSWVGHLRDLVGFLKDNSDWLVKFGEAAIFVAGAIVTYGIITKIAGIASAVEGLALALTANPIALLLTGVVAAGGIIYYEYNKMQAGMERNFEDMRRKGLQQDLFKGKLKPDDVTEAAKRCFLDWLTRRGTTGASDVEAGFRQVRAFIAANGASRFQPIRHPARPNEGNDAVFVVRDRVGFRRNNSETDETEYLILLDAFKDDVCKGHPYRAVLKELDKRGFLVREAPNMTIKPHLPELGRVRVYCIRAAILEGDDAGQL